MIVSGPLQAGLNHIEPAGSRAAGANEERGACVALVLCFASDINAPTEWRKAWKIMADLLAERPKWEGVLYARIQAETKFPWET